MTVNLSQHAYDVIAAECSRSGDLETGGWLAGHIPRSWQRDHSVTDATVAVKSGTRNSVYLDEGEFSRMHARLRREAIEVGGHDFVWCRRVA